MAETRAPKKLGRWMSLAMVVGSMIGSGIYLLPATLAPFGINMIIAFAVTIGGTLCLALSLALLARHIPGGPFAYVERSFGETAAFVTMWSYLVSQWTGVAGVAVAVAGTLSFVVPWTGHGAGLLIVSLGSIAALTLVNLRGVRSAGELQIATTLIKIVPLVAVVLFVIGRWSAGAPTEALAEVPLGLGAVVAASALTLFSLTGFEAAAVVADVTDESERNVPLATLAGTAFTGFVYLTATVAALLLLPSAAAAGSGTPFADAIASILGPVAGAVVTAIAAVSAFGTANSLILFAAEVGRTLAKADDLPRLFRNTNASGVPTGSLLISAGLAGLLVLASATRSFVPVYIFITLVSTVAALVLYLVCAAAALKLRVTGQWTPLIIIAVAYAVAMFFGAGWKPTLAGLGLAAAGLPIRWLSRRLNSRATSPAAVPAPAAPRE